MQNFPDCIAHVLAAEGGLVNDPQDPGGVTKFGISQRAYPALDIRALSLDDAKAIYQRDNWARSRASASPRASTRWCWTTPSTWDRPAPTRSGKVSSPLQWPASWLR